MGVLVSSLVDLEAEEGKILQRYKLAIASEKKSVCIQAKDVGWFLSPKAPSSTQE